MLMLVKLLARVICLVVLISCECLANIASTAVSLQLSGDVIESIYLSLVKHTSRWCFSTSRSTDLATFNA